MGVIASIFFSGACLLPGPFTVLSGELYIPKTSARASFVLIVTVGSAPPMRLRLCPAIAIRRMDLCPSSLKFTGIEDEDCRKVSEAGGGPHFFPRSPMERALASWILYSTPSSVNSSPRSKRNFSRRLPGAGGANISAYRDSAVVLKETGLKEDTLVGMDDDDLEELAAEIDWFCPP